MIRRFARLLAALAFSLHACDRAPPPENQPEKPAPTTPGDPDKPTTKTGQASTERCPSFALLDVATLPELPASKHVATLEQVWRKVLEKHYDPTLGCRDWPALRQRYGARLVGVSDQAEAYAIINEMLTELGQSHLRLFDSRARADEEERVGPALPPLSVRWLEDRLVVVSSAVTGKRSAVYAGAILLAIDGDGFEHAITRIKARAPRPAEFAFEIGRVVQARMSCLRAGQSHALRVTDPHAGDKEVVRVVRCIEPEGELVTLGNLRDVPTRVEHRMLDDRATGYIAFNVWMLPMVKRVEEAMTELRGKGMKRLVLDLRGNPGGVGAMSVPVARLLLSEPASLGRLQFRDFAQEFNVEPGGDPFTGKIALLVDEGTASTSEIFAAGLHDLGRVTIFGGSASAGAALPSVIDELEGGALLQYVVGDYRSPKHTVVEGVGVVPDVIVPEPRAEFAAGRDPVLRAATEFLAKE